MNPLVQQSLAYALLAVGGGGFLLSNRATIGKGLSWLFSLGGSAAPAIAADDDTADFQALARIQHRFERLNCKEGIDACTVCLTHFFHGHPGQP